MTSTVPAFEFFSGHRGEKSTVWPGTVGGLGAARDRSLQFAAKQPGAERAKTDCSRSITKLLSPV